jgi:hypothetical protein
MPTLFRAYALSNNEIEIMRYHIDEHGREHTIGPVARFDTPNRSHEGFARAKAYLDFLHANAAEWPQVYPPKPPMRAPGQPTTYPTVNRGRIEFVTIPDRDE